jgi:hypothetical protein
VPGLLKNFNQQLVGYCSTERNTVTIADNNNTTASAVHDIHLGTNAQTQTHQSTGKQAIPTDLGNPGVLTNPDQTQGSQFHLLRYRCFSHYNLN